MIKIGNIYNTPKKVFDTETYLNIVVQYQGNIVEEVSKNPDYYVTVINDKYAILSFKSDKSSNFDESSNLEKIKFDSIVYIKEPEFYTLQSISPIDAAQIRSFQISQTLSLTGKGVLVGIIDTGIDYLSEDFMDEYGKTRLHCIWDQTVKSEKEDTRIPGGTVYFSDKINEAINLWRKGGDPYEIVPSRDEVGHGTSMSSIIAARGSKHRLKGVVPECNLVVVKLAEDKIAEKKFKAEVPVYNITSLFTAIQYLYDHAQNEKMPLVLYLPLGTNSGNHKGNGVLEEFIEDMSMNRGVIFVTGVGNEGSARGHVSGKLSYSGEKSSIQLDVVEDMDFLSVEFWIDSPNIMTIEVISPSGENTGITPSIINSKDYYTFIFENTSIAVKYYIPEELSGDELISIKFKNIKKGIWLFRLTGQFITDGIYNGWLLQSGIINSKAFFNPSDPYGTIMNPASSKYIVTAAVYNQNNNNLVNFSGVANKYDYIDRIDLAAGGISTLALYPGGKEIYVSGSSVAAAVLAGACALLLEWGIIEGNDPYIYSQTIKTYIIRGASKRPGDIYPNPQLGYGLLNLLGIFQNMT